MTLRRIPDVGEEIRIHINMNPDAKSKKVNKDIPDYLTRVVYKDEEEIWLLGCEKTLGKEYTYEYCNDVDFVVEAEIGNHFYKMSTKAGDSKYICPISLEDIQTIYHVEEEEFISELPRENNDLLALGFEYWTSVSDYESYKLAYYINAYGDIDKGDRNNKLAIIPLIKVDLASYSKELPIDWTYLDSKDLTRYVRSGLDVRDVINNIEEDFNKEYIELTNISYGIFAQIDEEDFCEYIKRRYNKDTEEHIERRIK